MDLELFNHFLPEEIVRYFEIKSIEEEFEKSLNRNILLIHLDERNELRSVENIEDYESKGFLPSKKIQDFPIRGKAVYLMIRLRRWRSKLNKSIIVQNDYSFIADGTKLTTEIATFLKSTGRDPSRYH